MRKNDYLCKKKGKGQSPLKCRPQLKPYKDMKQEITTAAASIQAAANEKEESALRQVRAAIIGHYANEAVDVFRRYVDLTDEEFSEFMRVTERGQIVFTQPTEAAIEEDRKSETPRFTKGRRFGTTQWYKKSQSVGTALALLTSYSSFIRYMDSKEHAAERDAKRLDSAAATFAEMTPAQQAEYIARLQAMLTK